MRSRFLTRPGWLLAAGLVVVAGCGTGIFLNITRVQVDERVRLLLGGGCNSALFLHGREALVVDPKMGDFARRLRRDVEDELSRKVRRIVITHWHADHANGVSLFPEVGAVLVHPSVRERLTADGKLRWVPYVEVEKELQLVLGGEEVRVMHLGPAHTGGDLVVYLPEHRLLVSGDLFMEGWEVYADQSSGGSILGLRRAVDELMKLDFEKVVPGHGAVMDRAAAQRSSDYLAAMEEAVAAQLAAGASEEQAVEAVKLPEFPLMRPLPFTSGRERNVRAMYRELSEAAKKPAP